MTLQLLREGRKVQQVVYGREYMLRYVQRGVHAQVFSDREYMLRYVQRGVHAQVCSERSSEECRLRYSLGMFIKTESLRR